MPNLSAAPSRAHLATSELAQELRIDRSPSNLVDIDAGALRKIATHVRNRDDFRKYERYKWDDPKFWYPEGTPSERSQYFAVGNAINFRYWRLEGGNVLPAGGVIDGQRLTGAMYMWRCLRRCLDSRRLPLFQASLLAELTEEQFDEVFADDTGVNPLAIAKEDRLANLRDLGKKLECDWGGSFHNLTEAANGSFVELVRLSSRFRAFDDPLFKLTMVNTILHLGSGVMELDADPLPGIDYHLLKQLLRQGVIVPHPSVAEKLKRNLLLSEQEGYEVRRAALNAFVEISAQTGLSGEILDNKWWWNRLKCQTIDPVCLNPQAAYECPFLDPCAQHTQLGMPLEETRYY